MKFWLIPYKPILFLVTVFIAFGTGVETYAQKSEKFSISKFWPEDKIEVSEVSDASIDTFGNLWFIENQKVFRFNGEISKEFKQIPDKFVAKGLGVSGNFLTILTTKGYYVIDLYEEVINYHVLKLDRPIEGGVFDGEFWYGFATKGQTTQIVKQSIKTHKASITTFNIENVKDIELTEDGLCLLADSFVFVNFESGQITLSLRINQELAKSIIRFKANEERVIFKDGSHRLWAAHKDSVKRITDVKVSGFDVFEGKIVYKAKENIFIETSDLAFKELLRKNFETKLSGDESFIFVSKKSIWSLENYEIKQIKLDKTPMEQVYVQKYDKHNLSIGIRQIYNPSYGEYYYIGASRGLIQVEKGTNNFVKLIPVGNLAQRQGIITIQFDNGYLYLYTLRGIVRFNIETQNQETLIDPFKFENTDPTNKDDLLNGFYMDDKYVWAGTKNYKLYQYNRKTKKVKEYIVGRSYFKTDALIYEITGSKSKPTIALSHFGLFYHNVELDTFLPVREIYKSLNIKPNVQLSSVSYSKSGHIVMSSFNKGLFIYDIALDSLYQPDNSQHNKLSITDVFRDSENIYWCSSSTGLLSYNCEGNNSQLYTTKEGLLKDFLHYRYFSEDSEGNLYLGYSNSYLKFNYDKLKDVKNHSLIIKEVSTNNTVKGNSYSVWNDKELVLKPTENNLSIVLGERGMQDLDIGNFQYRLIGQNSSWKFPTQPGKLTFIGLESGDYTFEARSAEDAEITRFFISVTKPFWATTWFLILIFILSFAILYSFFKLRTTAIKKQAELKQTYKNELQELEIKALRSQMNSHFIFNSLNSIKSFIANNEPRKATKYLNKFALLIRLILSSTKESQVSLQTELKTISSYLDLEQLRFADSFNYEIELDENLNPETTNIPPLLLQPFLENAVWHGLLPKLDGDRQILISIFQESKSRLKVDIVDNGIGRVQSRILKNENVIRKSFGIEITNERLNRFKGSDKNKEAVITDLYDDNGVASGTKVEIYLPVL